MSVITEHRGKRAAIVAVGVGLMAGGCGGSTARTTATPTHPRWTAHKAEVVLYANLPNRAHFPVCRGEGAAVKNTFSRFKCGLSRINGLIALTEIEVANRSHRAPTGGLVVLDVYCQTLAKPHRRVACPSG
jgi:hypothetical protein